MLLPYQPPPGSPCTGGGCTDSTSATESPTTWSNCPWVGRSVPTAALGQREVKGLERRGQARGLSRKPTKCLGSPDPRSKTRP